MPKENEEAQNKILKLIKIVGFLAYLFNLMWYGFPLFKKFAPFMAPHLLDVGLNFLQNRFSLFSHPYITLFWLILCIGMYGWCDTGKRTSKYTPPFYVKWLLSLMVSLKLHEPFEYIKEQNEHGVMITVKLRERQDGWAGLVAGILLILLCPVFLIHLNIVTYILYFLVSFLGLSYFTFCSTFIHRTVRTEVDDDNDNSIQESFQQNTKLIESDISVNLRTKFMYQGKIQYGWINVVNPFRATDVLGTPGSGKSFAIINEYIRQHLRKLFTMYCYDFKFPDLSLIVYNHMKWNENNFLKKYGVKPRFCVINFDDPRKSLRCNPISAKFMGDITDAYDAAYTIMLNLNKSWAQKQGDFFVESPINYLTSVIWYLKSVEGGKYCTLPHAIEFVNSKYTECIPIMSMNPELVNYMSAFFEAWEGGAQDQLQGQISSVRIPLSRISSPQLYWVMSGDDFSLDLNNPEDPKVLCVGNNPEKKDIYATALGLYNGRIVKVINKHKKHKISLIIDELPTMYFRGLDNLIATARSNKVSVCLGFQDYTQLIRDYGDKEAKAIINTIGNLFSGQVTGDTAKSLENRFGRNKQKRKSVSLSESGESTSISEQNDIMIPASKISTLTQGTFVGAVADNIGEEISQKIFNAQILIDINSVKAEEKAYQPLPTFYSFDNKKVVKGIKESLVDFFVKDKSMYVLLAENQQELASIASISDVDKFISSLFTKEGSHDTKLAESISNYGHEIIKKIITFQSELENQTNRIEQDVIDNESDFETAKNKIIESVAELVENIKDWLERERKQKKPDGVVSVYDMISSLIKTVKSTSFDDRYSLIRNTQSSIDKIENFFRKMAGFKSILQKTRDAAMHEKLKENENQIREDIKALIKRQMDIIMNATEEQPDLFDLKKRVEKANG